jgi:nicotinate-nucleotide adenylyltransferase
LRIGVLGGTFDPIHLGHLRAAENARQSLGLDRVIFVPAGVPPHRPGPACQPIDRFAMVALATAGHPAFVASDVELRRDGPSYTVDTVASMSAAGNPADEFCVIVGSDSFAEILSWKDPKRLFSLCAVAVVERPPEPEGPQVSLELAGPFGGARIERVTGQGLPISASSIRRLISEGRSVRYLVPDAVFDYIEKRGLYR